MVSEFDKLKTVWDDYDYVKDIIDISRINFIEKYGLFNGSELCFFRMDNSFKIPVKKYLGDGVYEIFADNVKATIGTNVFSVYVDKNVERITDEDYNFLDWRIKSRFGSGGGFIYIHGDVCILSGEDLK